MFDCFSRLSVCILILFFGSIAIADQVVEYNYDSQGRLTFVKDSVNGNRDYDYDSAGNRLIVKIGSDIDTPKYPPSPPSACEIECAGHSDECEKKNPVCLN